MKFILGLIRNLSPNGEDLTFYITFMPTDRHSLFSVIFTNGIGTASFYRIIMWDHMFVANYGTSDNAFGRLPYLMNVKFKAEVRINECIVDGTSYALPSYTGLENTQAITIFNRYDGLRQISGRLYSFRIDKAGMKVLDLIPVRIGDEGYMYDRISGNLFGNQGSGKFILGPDIN